MLFLDFGLQNSRFRKARSAVSVILECVAREPHTPAGGVRRENDCRLSIQRIKSLRWQKFLDSSTQILYLILWMPYFRAKFVVLSSWSFVHWFRKDERFCFSVKYRTCPFLKRSQLNESNNTKKIPPRVEEENQKKRQRRAIADSAVVV